MELKEDISTFYRRIHYVPGKYLAPDKPHINVFPRTFCRPFPAYSRRDYYKVTLILGEGRLEYNDRVIYVNRPALLFTSPLVPYSWRSVSEKQDGWFCIFNESFVRQRAEMLAELPMFQLAGEKLFFLNRQQTKELSSIFRKMMAENEDNYPYKQDLLRNYLHLVIHFALKMQPVVEADKPVNAASRITSQFLELLERQFPIDSLQNKLLLTSANDFANQLSVHTNHLNRAVKEITGKTTTDHIAARIIIEANELLAHSDWPVAEIAYCLGFEYPAYFNNFFKKATGRTPKEARLSTV